MQATAATTATTTLELGLGCTVAAAAAVLNWIDNNNDDTDTQEPPVCLCHTLLLDRVSVVILREYQKHRTYATATAAEKQSASPVVL